MKQHYTASVQVSRFRQLAEILGRNLTSSGQHVSAFINKTGEIASYVWHIEKNIGKKLLLGYGYKIVSKRVLHKVIPMFDHYSGVFGYCDHYNKSLAGKNWPYTIKDDYQKNGDFILTCLFLNVYHLWLDADFENRSGTKWNDFCGDLADAIVEEKIV